MCEWIEIKSEDDLPKNYQRVIVDSGCAFYDVNRKIWYSLMERDVWNGDPREIHWTVTHWMPFPELPKKAPEEPEKAHDGRCVFDIAWRGRCKKDSLVGEEYCAEHLGVRCTCGEKAIGSCNHTGQFVCGYPTCQKNLICHNHQHLYTRSVT